MFEKNLEPWEKLPENFDTMAPLIQSISYPPVPENPEIGTTYRIYPEGCVSGNGTAYHGGMRIGKNPKKLIIYFNGGGVSLLLETMAGKGTEVGGRFEELREILDRTERQEQMGVCLDTCHVWDAGYDIVSDLDGVLTEFDRIVGLSRLRAIHLNDSLNPLGAKKDRHAKIGEGHIGLDALVRVINHPALRNLPFCLTAFVFPLI